METAERAARRLSRQRLPAANVPCLTGTCPRRGGSAGLQAYQLPTNLFVSDKRGTGIPRNFCRPCAWITLPLNCHPEHSARRLLRARFFCGPGGRGMKDLCIPLRNPDEWASRRCYTAPVWRPASRINGTCIQGRSRRAGLQPRACSGIAIGDVIPGAAFRMTSWGGELVASGNYILCTKRECINSAAGRHSDAIRHTWAAVPGDLAHPPRLV